MKYLKVVGGMLVGIGIILLVGLLTGYPIKWIVNWLFTPSFLLMIFGVTKISFWQAFWLYAICSSLFKGSSSSK